MMDVMVAASTSGKRERREGGDVPAAVFPVKGPTKDGRADAAGGATSGTVGGEEAGAEGVAAARFS